MTDDDLQNLYERMRHMEAKLEGHLATCEERHLNNTATLQRIEDRVNRPWMNAKQLAALAAILTALSALVGSVAGVLQQTNQPPAHNESSE